MLAQRLVRVLCNNCKEETELTKHEITMLDIDHIPEDARVCKPVGCDKCNHTGYAGMTVVAELLLVTDTIRQLILQKADASTIKKAGVKEGMVTLNMDSLDKIFQGITSVEEILRAIISEAEEE